MELSLHPPRGPAIHYNSAVKDAVYFSAAREICRRHAKGFYFASHFLPEPKRSHAWAVYAFCRLLDDVADTRADSADRVQKLVDFDELLDRIYVGDVPDEPLERDRALRAFEITIRRCNIPKRYFETLAEGYRMDLTPRRYAAWVDLEDYCYHVAGVAGLILCRVLGVRSPRADDRAIELGNAMRLTHILRNLRDDFARGRVYLPTDEMRMFGVDEAMLGQPTATPELRELVRYQVARARDLYLRGCEGLALLDNDGSRFTIALLAAMHGGILPMIERHGYDVVGRRVVLSRGQKLTRLAAALRLARRESGDALPDVF